MLPPDQTLKQKPSNPRPFNTKDNTRTLIIQERSTFVHRHPALLSITTVRSKPKKRLREILPHFHVGTLQNTPQNPVSDEKRKSFYVTDDISFGFHIPHAVKSPLQCSHLKQCRQYTVAEICNARSKSSHHYGWKHHLLLFEQRVYRYRKLRRRCLKEFGRVVVDFIQKDSLRR